MMRLYNSWSYVDYLVNNSIQIVTFVVLFITISSSDLNVYSSKYVTHNILLYEQVQIIVVDISVLYIINEIQCKE